MGVSVQTTLRDGTYQYSGGRVCVAQAWGQDVSLGAAAPTTPSPVATRLFTST